MILNYEQSRYLKLFDSENDNNRIDISMNTAIYDSLVDKYKNGIFKLRPNPVGEKLSNARSKFIGLNPEEQIYLLKNILQLTIHNQGVDLRKIGESSKAGTMKINKNLSDCKEAILINETVTGLFVNEIDLLKI